MARRSRPGQNKPWKPGMRVLVYIRVSKVGDRKDTLISDDVQESVCLKWAEREGLVIVGEPVADIDKSGRDISKRQIAKSIARVRKGEADGIVVWKVSRWGRDLLDSMLNVKELQESGGFIASATESLEEIETPMGKFSLTQMLAIAQLQSDQIGETWMNIQDWRVDKGLPRSGRPRFGYAKNEVGRDDDPAGTYTPDPTTGPWLKKCYESYVGGQSLTGLVKELRANGITTTTGGVFTYGTLVKSLDSGFGAGLIVDRRHIPRTESGAVKTTNPNECTYSKGAHEPVIDMKTWEAYVKRRAEVRPPREVVPVHRLSGLVYCGSCGRKVSTTLTRKKGAEPYRKFQCFKVAASGSTTRPCAAPVYMKQRYVEDGVLDWLRANARGEGSFELALERQRQSERAKADAQSIKDEIDRLTKRRKNLLGMKADADEDEREEIEELRQELKKTIDALETRHAEISSHAIVTSIPSADAFVALAESWEVANIEIINGALRSVIKKVYVDRAPHSRNRWATHDGRVRVVPIWEDDPFETIDSK